jgi:predicted O-methyltransferase YrrM
MLSWEKHVKPLSELKRSLRMLDVGGYEGEITAWFLNNLASNPDSHVYVIDTWKDSSKLGIDVKKIHRTFQRTIKETKKEDQVTILNIERDDALYHLLDLLEDESIDVAFVDASQDPQDVMIDAILIWKLLRKDGILICNDYEVDDLDEHLYKSRKEIDKFIRNYSTELTVLEIGRQLFIKKNYTNSKELSVIDYKSWYMLTKRITSLSDFIMNSLTSVIQRKTLRVPKPTKTSTTILLTKTPFFTKSDEVEQKIRELISGKERIFFEKVIMPSIPTRIGQEYSGFSFYTKLNSLHNTHVSLDSIETLSKYESRTQSMLELMVEESNIEPHFLNYDASFKIYKKVIPMLKHHDFVYIKLPENHKTYSHIPYLKVETLESLETMKYHSLKSNQYDTVLLALLADATLSYEYYSNLKFHGRDSASIKWNSLYVLMATHCLKKGGNLYLVLYGSQTPIVCEFISYIDTMFTHSPILQSLQNRNNSSVVNVISCNLRGYKGITKEQQETLMHWYTVKTPSVYYQQLGVPCNAYIKSMMQQISAIFQKNIITLYKIAKEYKKIIDKLTPSEKEKIVQYIIGLRINNYFNKVAKLL